MHLILNDSLSHFKNILFTLSSGASMITAESEMQYL